MSASPEVGITDVELTDIFKSGVESHHGSPEETVPRNRLRDTGGIPLSRSAVDAQSAIDDVALIHTGNNVSVLDMAPTPAPVWRPAVRPEDDPRVMLRRYRHLAITGDATSAIVATLLAVMLRFGFDNAGWYGVVPLVAPLAWVGIIAIHRGYEQRFLGSGPDEFRRVVDAGLVTFTLIAVASYIANGDVSRGIVVFGVPTGVAGSLLVRRLLHIRLQQMHAAGRGLQRVLVVGGAEASVHLVEQLDRMPGHGYEAVGVCVPETDLRPAHVRDVPVVGTTDQVLDAVRETGAHVVAVASHPDLSGQSLRRLSWALEELGVELVVAPGIVEVAGPRLSIRPVAELSLLHLERPATRGGWLLLKAAFDVMFGTLLLLLVSPLMAAIAAAVRLGSRGPALFRQTRVGVDGRHFTIYKFRSMVVDADARKTELAEIDEGNGVLFKVRADPRVTRIGAFLRRFSLDELPQLINVVRGEMSLVGPRPPLPDEVAGYCDDAVRRLRVKPGLTGLWQVSGRSDLTWEESLRLDLRYVDNWSLMLDLLILWRTLRAVVRGSGAY